MTKEYPAYASPGEPIPAFGSDDQPRDEAGKWTSGGGGSSGGFFDEPTETAEERTHKEKTEHLELVSKHQEALKRLDNLHDAIIQIHRDHFKDRASKPSQWENGQRKSPEKLISEIEADKYSKSK